MYVVGGMRLTQSAHYKMPVHKSSRSTSLATGVTLFPWLAKP
jgi:hypothetical protein